MYKYPFCRVMVMRVEIFFKCRYIFYGWLRASALPRIRPFIVTYKRNKALTSECQLAAHDWSGLCNHAGCHSLEVCTYWRWYTYQLQAHRHSFPFCWKAAQQTSLSLSAEEGPSSMELGNGWHEGGKVGTEEWRGGGETAHEKWQQINNRPSWRAPLRGEM